MIQREFFKDDAEHETVANIVNEFWHNFSMLVAAYLNRVPTELELCTLDMLQERASVFGSDYDKYLEYDREPLWPGQHVQRVNARGRPVAGGVVDSYAGAGYWYVRPDYPEVGEDLTYDCWKLMQKDLKRT